MKDFKYDLGLDRSKPTSYAMLAEMVGYNKRVLVIGGAAGVIIPLLTERACRVTAVEPDPQSNGKVPSCERVLVGDPEHLDLVAELGSGSLDVVAFADAFERFGDPLGALRSIRPLLVAEGCVVASILNVAHGDVRLSLLQGRFSYGPSGILESSHLRFFTRESLGELFHEAGLALAEVERHTVDLFDTELEVVREELSPEVIEEVSRDPESRTYHFVVKAVVDNGLETVRKLQTRDEQRLRDLAAYRVQNGALQSDRDQWLARSQTLEAELALWKAQAQALEAERNRWLPQYEDSQHKLVGYRNRARDAEQRLREAETALAHLRSELESLRAERDSWRAQADQLARAKGRLTRESVRARGSKAARTVWSRVPESYRKVARPALRRLRVPFGDQAGAPGEDVGTPEAETEAGMPRPGAPQVIRERVSVLIPTLNAGPEFGRNLDSIRSQEGLASLEIVVADSGSSDGTVEVAEAMGARLLHIPPGEFNHGGTRNRMAEMATGDLFLMTVQDARLVGRYAIRDLVRTLRSERRIAAVSARGIPRHDADLFAAFLSVSHHGWIENHQHAAPSGLSEAETLAQRRVACWVDNVCSLIDRVAWEQVRFRQLAFAEDLDFGMRAAQQGWRLLPSFDVAVVHSHNREAAYHLRRIVVDRLFLGGLLGDTSFHAASGAGIEAVAAASRVLLGEIEAASRSAVADGTVALDRFLDGVSHALRHAPGRLAPTGELACLDEVLASDADVGESAALVSLLREDLVATLHVGDLALYARAHPAVPFEAAQGFLAKLSTRVIGTAAGDALRADPSPSPLGLKLRAGV